MDLRKSNRQTLQYKYNQAERKCIICSKGNDIKKSRFIKNQEAKGLLSNLVIRTPLSKVPILGDILLNVYTKLYTCLKDTSRKATYKNE